ncbi:MAG: sugar nucleotide-binding protein, partial [Emcibacter sp.]|nr:sugar nucleotide-binding protein [Emcibacter sp.]
MSGLVIFGATGMLGQVLMKEAQARDQQVSGVARRGSDYDLDIGALSSLSDFLCRTKPEIIINSAAIINLVGCEEQPEAADTINAKAVQVMADYCQSSDAFLVQISTDQYFRSMDPVTLHDENAEIHLVNSYARTKYAGEEFALKSHNSIVIRTNVTGCRNARGPTFLEWAVSTLASTEDITGFADYYTSTIDRNSLAKAVFDLLDKQAQTGIYNIASSQVFSKFEFLSALSKELDIPDRMIKNGTVGSVWPDRCITLGLDV